MHGMMLLILIPHIGFIVFFGALWIFYKKNKDIL